MKDVRPYEIVEVAPSCELAETTALLLKLLPPWFGIPEANAEYVDSATRLPGLVARSGAEAIGVLLSRRHFPGSTEIHLMAVDPTWHRRGVGKAMVEALQAQLMVEGCKLLEVKTLGASRPDVGYAATRAFYLSCGFEPLEELHDLWPGNPCLIMVKPLP